MKKSSGFSEIQSPSIRKTPFAKFKDTSGVSLEALPYLENAIISDPSIFQFWVSLSETLVQLGQFEEAIKIINLARESGLDGEEFTTLETKLNHQSI